MSRNTWRQSGDFSRYYGHNHGNPEGDARNIEFINTRDNAIIQKIVFIGAVNGCFHFYIQSANNLERTNIFRAEIRQLALPYSDVVDQHEIERDTLYFYDNGVSYSSLHFRAIDDSIFINVMTLIHNLEPTFESEMKDVVIGLINQYQNAPVIQVERRLSFSESQIGNDDDSSLGEFNIDDIDDDSSFTRTLAASFFHSAPSATASAFISEGKNAKTLSEISGFDSKTIPEIFCCAISTEIMDDPVYDPKHPQYKFDRKHIERWLANGSNNNPYTRTPLTKAQLVCDEDLKIRIQHFVSLTKKQAGNETFCGMRPGFGVS